MVHAVQQAEGAATMIMAGGTTRHKSPHQMPQLGVGFLPRQQGKQIPLGVPEAKPGHTSAIRFKGLFPQASGTFQTRFGFMRSHGSDF
jgi:hypothetical protein